MAMARTMISSNDKALILEFKTKLPQGILSHLKKLIIYGSRVRGDASLDSDLDIVALVDKKNSDIEKKIDDIAYQVMWDHDFRPIISLKVFAEKQFYDAVKKGFSFYQHVAKEGIAV